MVTNFQLYVAIGVPSLLALVNTGVMLVMFNIMNTRILRLEHRMDDMIGAINDLDKRLTRVEVKLGIQP